ncbi:MAG: LamG domain-containing protein, partial [Pirellulales bacterium]|nr:LamG domain-containing protein [Pirellulales bacterium]
MNRYPCNGFVGALTLLIPVCGLSADVAGVRPVYRVPDEKMTLDGTADYKVIPYDPAMTLPARSGKITVSAWVRTASPNRPQMVLKREGAWQLGIGGWEQPRGFFAVWSPEIHSIVSEPLLKSDQWEHVAGSYDGAAFTFFVNGKAVSSEPARHGHPVANVNQPLWIGANLPANKPELLFRGEIADMAIWDQALTAEEVAAVAANPPKGVTPSALIAPSAKAAPSVPVALEGQLGGVALSLDVGAGIRLQRIGDQIASSGGRVFTLLANGRRINSDQVVVRRKEVVVAADGWAVPFDLPDGLAAGTLRFSSGSDPGVIDTRMELTNGGPASVWRVLFPLVEGVTLNRQPAGDLEFFFPLQEGWLGKGECSLSAGYGTRAWLPVMAAWNPTGTGISLQVRDQDFDVHSLLFRNAFPGGKSAPPASNAPGELQKRLYGESYHPDGGRCAEAFPCEAPGLTMGVASLEFPLGITQTWRSKTFAIQTYDGKGLFKTPLASYGKWARATWWKHRPITPWTRDSFLAFPVHERGGGRGIEKGFWDGKKWLLGDQVEAYARDMGGHPFAELSDWWKQGDEITSGPFAGRFYPLTLGDYEFEPRFGGPDAYRAEIDRVHKTGGRVCLYVQGRLAWKKSKVGMEHAEDWAWMDKPGRRNLDWSGEGEGLWKTDYWNFCPQAKGWQEHLRSAAQRILTESGA